MRSSLRVYRRFHHDGAAERLELRGGIEMRPGVPEMLGRLHDHGLKLGLAANQPARVVAELDRRGVGQLFSHREVTGQHGYKKPDARLFLRACEDLGIEPGNCLMVGDRIDNDIAPARALGMRTALLRSGRHMAQQPRSANEVPDVEVRDVPGMEAAILSLAGSG
jgi:putative hydrolase of the HAD superfamily